MPEPSAILPPAGARVTLLAPRGAPADERLLQLLETRLSARGIYVFVHRSPAGNVREAREIARQVLDADAVVPLLSAATIDSEMLAYALDLTQEAARRGAPGPRVLSVRVSYSGPLPASLQASHESAPSLVWTGTEDDDTLLDALTASLQRPPAGSDAAIRARPVPPANLVAPDPGFYVTRPADEELRAAIARRDSIVRIRGARHMGKTALLRRGLLWAREAGARVVLTEVQMLDAHHLSDAGSFFLALASFLARELELDVAPESVWDPLQGPNWNFREFLLSHVLDRGQPPVVWGVDEADRLFAADFGTEVFGLFRSWHNERALNPGLPWSRLTLVLAYATEAHRFITDVNQSPFNVGTRIILQDLTLEQTRDLNLRYGSPLHGESEVRRYHRLVGGQPALTHHGLRAMTVQTLSLAELRSQAVGEDGPFGDHLQRVFMTIVQEPAHVQATLAVLRGQPCADPDSFHVLWSAGVMAGDSAREARLRSELYEIYLKRHLL